MKHFFILPLFLLLAFSVQAQECAIFTTADGKVGRVTFDSQSAQSKTEVIRASIKAVNKSIMGNAFDPVVHLDHVPFTLLDDSQLPMWFRGDATVKDRFENFRDAAEWDGVKIKINMDKAKIIHRDRILKAQSYELKRLKNDFIDALQVGDTVEQNRLSTLSQKVKNAQIPDMSQVTTVSELNAVWPADVPPDPDAPQ